MTSADSRLAAASNEIRVRVRVLEEEVDDRAAAQRRQLLDRPLGEAGELLGRVEDEDASSRLRSAAESRCCFTRTPPR